MDNIDYGKLASVAGRKIDAAPKDPDGKPLIWGLTVGKSYTVDLGDGPADYVFAGVDPIYGTVVMWVGPNDDDGRWTSGSLNDLPVNAHTIGGRLIDNDPASPSYNPGAYGRTHTGNCPACVASGASFTASPMSETYWSS